MVLWSVSDDKIMIRYDIRNMSEEGHVARCVADTIEQFMKQRITEL